MDDASDEAASSPASIVVQRRIEWPDTDASGMYHNTAAFRFIEVAETTLLDRLGFVHEIYGRHPRVHIEADFLRPLRFRDMVDIDLAVEAVGRTSVTYRFEMRSENRTAVRGRAVRSEERRVGKEGRTRWAPYRYKKRVGIDESRTI